MDRRRADYLPLTAEVVAAHLVGDVVHRACIRCWPDNTCHFLVADFDGPAAMLDALAYVKAARASGVPAALEISQSGRGAHVWVFFTDAVPAATARAVGTALLHEAMVLRGSMDLRSYDRLFPNQDVLPDGGFGNLIAAPLQGRRRRDGLTLFLDPATLEPYEDQWAFLSTLDRLSPGDAARRRPAGEAGAPSAPRSTAMSRSDATRVHPPLPPVVHAELGAGLSLDAGAAAPRPRCRRSSTPPPWPTRSSTNCSACASPPGTLHGSSAATTSPSTTSWSCRAGCATRSPGSSNGPARGWPSPTCETPAGRSTSQLHRASSTPSRPPRSARCSPTTTACSSRRPDRARPSWPAP